MKIFKIIILFTLSSLTAFALGQPEEKFADLSKLDLDKEQSIILTTPWTFYWNQYLFDAHNLPPGHLVKNNFPWTEIPSKKAGHSEFGYGTYHIKIKLPKRSSTHLALTIRRIKTDFAVYIDNKYVAHMGSLDKYPVELAGQSNTTNIFSFDVPLEKEAIDVLIHVSNNSYYRGGMDQPPELAYSLEAHKGKLEKVLAAAFTAGALLFMGIYHFGLWLKRRSNLTSLFFSILAVAVGIRVFFTYKIFYLLFPFATESLVLRCEIALAFTALPFLHIFISSVFPEESNKFMTRLSWFAWATLMSITVFGSLKLMGQTLTPFKIYFVITLFHMIKMGFTAMKNHREGSVLFSAGFIIALLTGVHDVLFENDTIYGFGQPIFPFGVLTFVFIQFVLHSMRFSRAYRELETFKNTLENQVEERTRELTIAHQIASKSHEETRLLSAAMTNLLEDERKSIARELHDDFGQTIRAAGLYADSIAKEAAKPNQIDTTAIVQNASKISQALMDVYNKNRNLLRRLRPEIIDTLGLKSAIEELLENYRRNHFNIEFTCDSNLTSLDNKQKITIYRILQEAMTNIVKYSGTNTVVVSLNIIVGNYELKVKDFGIGFDVNNAKGIGLISMRERLAEIGGNLRIESSPNLGTTLTATLPVNY